MPYVIIGIPALPGYFFGRMDESFEVLFVYALTNTGADRDYTLLCSVQSAYQSFYTGGPPIAYRGFQPKVHHLYAKTEHIRSYLANFYRSAVSYTCAYNSVLKYSDSCASIETAGSLLRTEERLQDINDSFRLHRTNSSRKTERINR